MIDRIEGLTSLKNLIQLSLYNNQIMRIEGLEGLTSLRKLYLEKNHIDRLEGLTGCRNLEELYLSGQNTETEFTFDDYSLAAISGSLRYLDLGSSNVVHSKPLYYLERLEVLILKRNRISDFEDDVVPML
jgi:Leucine-rich repeat (LRR) protein